MNWQEELLQEVKVTNRWLRILAMPKLREVLDDALSNPQLKRIYQESDGRQIRSVAEAAGAGFGTVQRHWKVWADLGIVEPTQVEGRYRRIVDLKDLEMEE